MKILITLSLILFHSHVVWAQLEFTKRDKWFFVGADSIEGNRIISDVVISPVDSSHLKLTIGIRDNFILKETILDSVKIDTSSIRNDKYFIDRNNKKLSAYRFYSASGLEILVTKELWNDNSYNSKGEKLDRYYTLLMVDVKLPRNKKRYVKTLPLMFEK